jgi:hypothetical protein
LDQRQLQIARAALWHQTAASDPAAPLRTLDDAASWLDDMGIALFLPRHTQLPSPAPSLVEACQGAPSVTPTAGAIAQATELLVRLVGERRLVPLNLLGTFSEQPDFVVTPEVLPWVAAVRGDRQWKTAPGGRTSPIVLRTYEALDREGELTAVQVREKLGHEITEAAALRALMELWTGLRAMPVYAQSEPARWTLLKNRFATQLATAANTAQTTALSALASLYLHSAVAATAEEAEIFLSPLTARSRIREVLHGMTSTRQLGATTVASQTLLFVEGSLPETVAAPEPEPTPRPAPTSAAPRLGPRAIPRKEPRPTKWELPARDAGPQTDQSRPWQKKPAAAHRLQPGASGSEHDTRPSGGARPGSGPDRRRRESRPFTGGRSGGGARPAVGPRPVSGPRPSGQRSGSSGPRFRSGFSSGPGNAGAKPWQKRGTDSFRAKTFSKPKFEGGGSPGAKDRPKREGGPQLEPRWRGPKAGPPRFNKERTGESKPRWRDQKAGPPPFRKDREGGEKKRPWQKRPAFGGARPAGATPGGEKRPWQKRPAFGGTRPAGATEGEKKRPWQKRPSFGGARPAGATPGGEKRPWQKRPAFRGARPPGAGEAGGNRPGGPSRSFRPERPFAGKTGRPSGSGDSRPSGPARPFRPGKPFASKPGRPSGSGENRPGGPARPFRPGKPFTGKPSSGPGRPKRRGPASARPGGPKNKFRKPSPAERKPRKNRSQKETPE